LPVPVDELWQSLRHSRQTLRQKEPAIASKPAKNGKLAEKAAVADVMAEAKAQAMGEERQATDSEVAPRSGTVFGGG
jgi:hypothetical protein